MPKIAIVGSARNETNVDIVAHWRSLGLDADLLSPADAVRELGPGDVAVARVDLRATIDGIEPGVLDLLYLPHAGIRLVNRPPAIIAAHDKLRSARRLIAAGLPHPRTEHVCAGEIPTFAPPFVVKPRFGSWGTDVLRCETEGEARQAFDSISRRAWFLREGALVQELIPPLGYDVRVVVVEGVVVGGAERLAAPGEWRTNVSLGGSDRSVLPTAAAATLAVAAVGAIGGDFFGVDLLPGPDGYVVLEVNAAVEFDGVYSLRGGDVYTDVAAALGLLAPTRAAPPLAAALPIP